MTSVMIAVLLLQASALAQTRSVTVSGRVTPAPGPAVAAMSVLRVAVISSGYPPAVREAPVPADGSFQISNVAPGPHIVRVRAGVLPAVQDTPFPALGIFAGDTDVTGLELAGPVAVPGRVLVEGGRPLPTARMEAAPVALAANPSGTGGFAFGTPVGPDGSFVLLVTPGEYRLTSPRLPAGYVVKAMSFSGTDLQRGTLSLYQPSSSEILVTLGAPAGGVTVRGRVLGLPATGPPAGLAVAMAGVAVPVRADGTFEFLGVQPGNRDFLLRGGPTLWPSQVSSRARIAVTDRDVSGVQLQWIPLTDVFTRIVAVDGTGQAMTTAPGNVALAISSRDGTTINYCDQSPCRANTVNIVVGDSRPLLLPRIEYNVRADGAPAGYTVKAISCGGVDLLREPLKIDHDVASVEIEVQLETTTGARVAGRIVPTPTSSVLPKAVTLRGSGSLVFQAEVSGDGTFEFLGVPPGTYTATTILAGLLPYGSQTTGIIVREAGLTPVRVLALSGAQVPLSTQYANEAAAVLNLVAVQKAAANYYRAFRWYGNIAAMVAVGLLDARYTWQISGYDLTSIVSGNDFVVMATPASPDAGRYVFYSGAAPSTLGYSKADPAGTASIPNGALQRDAKGRLVFADGTSIGRVSTCGSPMCLRFDDQPASRSVQVSGLVSIHDRTALPSSLHVGFEFAEGGGNLTAVSPNGAFSVAVPAGEHRLVVSGLPSGYSVTAASAGNTDLLRRPFLVTDSAAIPPPIMVTLAPRQTK